MLGKYFKNFAHNSKKETGLKGFAFDFLADYFSVDVDNILDIH